MCVCMVRDGHVTCCASVTVCVAGYVVDSQDQTHEVMF